MPDWDSYEIPKAPAAQRMKEELNDLQAEYDKLGRELLDQRGQHSAARTNIIFSIRHQMSEVQEKMDAARKSIAMDTSWNTRGANDGLL